MYDIIIVGGGPAGLAASVYAARKRLKAVLISVDIGGQMNRTFGIENYLGYQFIEGAELISKFQSQVERYPIEQQIGTKVSRVRRTASGFEVAADNGQTFESRVVIYAAGKRPRELNVPGEREFAGKGVSYCAICDGPLFAEKRVAVIGGGNSALEAGLDLVKIAEHVDLVSLGPISGDAVLYEKLREAKNLDVHIEFQTEKILGSDFVEGLVLKDLKSGKTLECAVGGVFVEIGLIPNSEPLEGFLQLNGRGEAPVNCAGETAVPGFFAAGDVSDVPEKQIIVAAGEGAKAMLRAHSYLQRL